MFQETLSFDTVPESEPTLTKVDMKYIKRLHEFVGQQGWQEFSTEVESLFQEALLRGKKDPSFKSMAGVVSILTVLRSKNVAVRFNVLVKKWYSFLGRKSPKRLLKLRYRVQKLIAPEGIPILSALALFERVFKDLWEQSKIEDRRYIEQIIPRTRALIIHYQRRWSGQGRTAHSLISAVLQFVDLQGHFSFGQPLCNAYFNFIRPEGQSRTRYHYSLQDLRTMMQEEYQSQRTPSALDEYEEALVQEYLDKENMCN